MKRCVVIAHPDGPNFEDIQLVVKTVNALQNYFYCELVPEKKILSAQAREVSVESLANAIGKRFPDERVVALTESYYDSDLVIDERLPFQIMVTCAERCDDNAPSRHVFLLHSLASSLITFEARLSPEKNKAMTHDEPVGCLFDWWSSVDQLAVILVCARLCHGCQGLLQDRHQVAPDAIGAVNCILEHVRGLVLRKNPQVPEKVFIAHGWSEDWKDLHKILNELGVPIAEFEEVSTAGRAIPDRWKEMLDQSRFAFALLTPDEVIKKVVRLPRPNVIHEIGLCQGRMGLGKTVVLREKTVKSISNLSGVIDIEFESGKLRKQRDKIVKVLIAHGLLAKKAW